MVQFKNRHVTVFESALFRTTSTVVETEDLVLLVDPNWLPDEIQVIRQLVFEKIESGKPLFLLFTHSDYDHVLGYRAFSNASVIASQAFAENPDKEGVIEQILNWDDEYYISRNYLIEYPNVDFAIEEDGQTLEVGDTKLTFYLAPGHNADGIFTIVEPGGILLAGDYLCNVEFPYIYHSSQAYEGTLAKVDDILERHPISLLVPGHGDVATETAEILVRKKEALDYIRKLRRCLLEGREFNVEKLWERYRFPRLMRKFHEENVKLMKKELGLK